MRGQKGKRAKFTHFGIERARPDDRPSFISTLADRCAVRQCLKHAGHIQTLIAVLWLGIAGLCCLLFAEPLSGSRQSLPVCERFSLSKVIS